MIRFFKYFGQWTFVVHCLLTKIRLYPIPRFFSVDSKEGVAVQSLNFFFSGLLRGCCCLISTCFFSDCGRGRSCLVPIFFPAVDVEEGAAVQYQYLFQQTLKRMLLSNLDGFFQGMWKRALLSDPQTFFLCGFSKGHCWPILIFFSAGVAPLSNIKAFFH